MLALYIFTGSCLEYTFLALGLYPFVFINKLLPYQEENQLKIWEFQAKEKKNPLWVRSVYKKVKVPNGFFFDK